MKFRPILSVLALAIVVVLLIATVPASKNDQAIVDVSWPNCHANIEGTIGIIGVTGGLSFRPNPCLAAESTWFSQVALYMNTGYPGNLSNKSFPSYPRRCTRSDSRCLAYNYGYNGAVYAINYANSQGVYSRIWWLDVETDNSWDNNPLVNRASLRGAIAAVHQHVFMPTVGIYSYPGQWQLLTGDWHNTLPNWVATGSRSRAVAVSYCRTKSFTSGPIWLAQYTQKFDKNYACSQDFMNSLDNLESANVRQNIPAQRSS